MRKPPRFLDAVGHTRSVGIRDALQNELALAMRRKDTSVVAAVRSTLSTLANAEATPQAGTTDTSAAGSIHFAGSIHGVGGAEVERRTLTEKEQRNLVAAEAAELSHHADRLSTLCRRDEADAARRASRILSGILEGD